MRRLICVAQRLASGRSHRPFHAARHDLAHEQLRCLVRGIVGDCAFLPHLRTRQEVNGRIVAHGIIYSKVHHHVVGSVVERPRRHNGTSAAVGNLVVWPRVVGMPCDRAQAGLNTLPHVAHGVPHGLAADGRPFRRAVLCVVRLHVQRHDGWRIRKRVADGDEAVARLGHRNVRYLWYCTRRELNCKCRHSGDRDFPDGSLHFLFPCM